MTKWIASVAIILGLSCLTIPAAQAQDTATPTATLTSTPTNFPANTATVTRTSTPTTIFTATKTPTSTTSPTATETPTATVTSTATVTPTPTVERQGALAQGYTCGAGGMCPTPPCDLPAIPGMFGHKTIAVGARGQAPTVKVIGRVVTSPVAPEILIKSMTGASCDTTAANCFVTSDDWYDEIFLRVTACPTPATIDGWMRQEIWGK
jgi:hypothetical protein